MPRIKLPAPGPRTVALAVLTAGALSAAIVAPAAAGSLRRADGTEVELARHVQLTG